MTTKNKKETRWKRFYWLIVLFVFISLIFMVRFVLNTSKIYVETATLINPYQIEWNPEKDGSLRINEPFYVKTDLKLVGTEFEKINLNLENRTSLDSIFYLKDVTQPYLIWKNKDNDTIHILKNNVHLNFILND